MRRPSALIRKKGRKGSILLETVIAMFMMTVVGLSLLALIQKGTVAAFKAREHLGPRASAVAAATPPRPGP